MTTEIEKKKIQDFSIEIKKKNLKNGLCGWSS